MNPREFLIEDWLEANRFQAECNLGESGLRNFSLGEILRKINIEASELLNISLADSPNRGREDLRSEIASLYSGINPEEVLITSGTSEALFILFNLLLKEGNEVSLFLPAFQALYEIPISLGAKIRGIEVKDKLEVERLFHKNTDFIIINHPHNPTGIGLKNSDKKKLTELIHEFKGYVLFDEHYRFLSFEEDMEFSGAGISENTFATGSITKCFGVTGLRIGWLIGDKKILDRARSFKDYLTHTVNPISEFLALEILKKRRILLPDIKDRIIKNIDFFISHLPHFRSLEGFQKPDGGLVGFAKLKSGIISEEFSSSLMKDCSVFVLPGKSFEKEGYIRIGFGETKERFQSGIERWKNWEEKHLAF